ncbi:amino acid-binding protein [bacterium]|nr:amino acid-binding protein [bacterium]
MERYTIKQLSVFLENKKGELIEITSILADEEISIKSLLLVDSTDFGILRLIVESTERAKTALSAAGFTVRENQVFAVKMKDRIGSFNTVVKKLSQMDINISYTYAYKEQDVGVLIFKVGKKDFRNALQALQEVEIEIIEKDFFA